MIALKKKPFTGGSAPGRVLTRGPQNFAMVKNWETTSMRLLFTDVCEDVKVFARAYMRDGRSRG